MRYAYYPGCKIPHHLPLYGQSTLAVCKALGIELAPIEFNCCGWPFRDESFLASMFAAARNLALADREGLNILTPCKCCFGNLKQAQARISGSPGLRNKIESLLAEEGLSYRQPRVFHLLSVLDGHKNKEVLQQKMIHPLNGLKVACHYGCHALRPAKITGFDNPLDPTIFERLMQAIGAETVDWDMRLECCGHPLRGKDEIMSQILMNKKLSSAQASGADVLATACTYCQLQFETERNKLPKEETLHEAPPAILFTQLIASVLGLEPNNFEALKMMRRSQPIGPLKNKQQRLKHKSAQKTDVL